jgi:hypothetical protein
MSMDYVECPEDGSHLKAAPNTRPVRQPLLLVCPTCGKRFALDRQGLHDAPPDEETA